MVAQEIAHATHVQRLGNSIPSISAPDQKRYVLTCNPNTGSIELVAATIACEMTCPPKTPRPFVGMNKVFDRKRFTSICSSSKEVEILELSAWFVSSIAIPSLDVGL